jgi:hypothetical protein
MNLNTASVGCLNPPSAHRPERIESPPCEIVRGANAARYERSPSVRLKDIFDQWRFTVGISR